MTPEELNALEALAHAATPGNWSSNRDFVLTDREIAEEWDIVARCTGHDTDQCKRDAAFLARCREAVPALIAALREARAERDTAFARGVAAMREAAVRYVHDACGFYAMASALRALPGPEDRTTRGCQ